MYFLVYWLSKGKERLVFKGRKYPPNSLKGETSSLSSLILRATGAATMKPPPLPPKGSPEGRLWAAGGPGRSILSPAERQETGSEGGRGSFRSSRLPSAMDPRALLLLLLLLICCGDASGTPELRRPPSRIGSRARGAGGGVGVGIRPEGLARRGRRRFPRGLAPGTEPP